MIEAQPDTSHQVRRWVLASLIVLCAGGVVLSFVRFDEAIINQVLRHRNAWAKIGWVDAFRQIGKAYVLIWLLLVWSCVTNRWRFTAVAILALVLVSLSVGPLKLAVARARPSQMIAAARHPGSHGQNDPPARGVSFPSGDTADVFAVATVLLLLAPGVWTPGLFAAAGVIGVLRVITLAHYPSDVFAGALIGLAAGCGAVWITARRLPESAFRVPNRWRLGAGLALVFVLPVVSPFLKIPALLIFFRVYGIPVVALMLIYAFLRCLRRLRPG